MNKEVQGIPVGGRPDLDDEGSDVVTVVAKVQYEGRVGVQHKRHFDG